MQTHNNSPTVTERVRGCLLGAALGDAAGAATEGRTPGQIRALFAPYLLELVDPPSDAFLAGGRAGMVTDDFWLGYYVLRAALAAGGSFSLAALRVAFHNWMRNPWYSKVSGPTTMAALARLFADEQNAAHNQLTQARKIPNNGNNAGSNGGAMKIFPAGLLHPAEPDKAIADAILICEVTHNNSLAISGATAIAASVSEALRQGASITSIIQAGIYGAERGFAHGEAHKLHIAGPSVARRIELAVTIAKNVNTIEQGMGEIYEQIGTGLHVAEAVPSVYGLLVLGERFTALGGKQLTQPLLSIWAAVNIGYDTDTIATMTGAIVGAFYGVEALAPALYLDKINKANQAIEADFDLWSLADQVLAFYKGSH